MYLCCLHWFMLHISLRLSDLSASLIRNIFSDFESVFEWGPDDSRRPEGSDSRADCARAAHGSGQPDIADIYIYIYICIDISLSLYIYIYICLCFSAETCKPESWQTIAASYFISKSSIVIIVN